MVPTYADFLGFVLDYQQKHRPAGLAPFEIEEPYDLFPQSWPPAMSCGSHWDESWPHPSRAGVYAFLDEDGKVLYVGKASFRNSIAARLSTYCRYEAGKGTGCRLNHQWKITPRYVVTVAVPEETRFEASALEEFLITKLEPPENSVGIGRNA